MNRIIIKLFFCLCLMVILPSYAYNTVHYYFRTIDIRNGLSHNSVNQIFQDRKGFMWFGTKDGLNRYDGLSFRVYNKENSNLGRNFITTFYEDKEGNIWIGTDAGVFIYNPVLDSFTPFNLISDKGTVIRNFVTMIRSDEQDNIWMSVEYQGLFCYNKQEQQLLNYLHEPAVPNVTRFWLNGDTFWLALHSDNLYYALVFQWGNVPFLTKLTDSPKQNFRSTSRDAILKKLALDMEFAIEWVPDQKDMEYVGMVNKGACRMLLSKIYLALGEYEKAKAQLDILIGQSGYSLMTNEFGTFNEGNEPKAWPIKRNVIWDLHRPENKLIAANKEVIMGMPNRGSGAESFIPMLSMRIFYPFFFDVKVKMPDGKQALRNYTRNDKNYDVNSDYMRGLGRGISTFRPSGFYTHDLWAVNGKMDKTDLRHSSSTGNWMRMEDLRCNNPESSYFGQNLTLHHPETGALLCSDTIRRWYDVPHYIFCLDDPVNQANRSNNGLEGATEGSVADWYLYRLAEAYLLRAEAKFYINPSDATIKDDLNIIRQRAQCSELYTGPCTIGDIMNERARELFFEEWRNVELTRVSLCLARSGRPDEWGNTYDLATFDKQSGTDLQGGSYWYQRCVRYGMYNKGVTIHVDATKTNINYIMGKHNIYWPIPEKAIVSNNKGQLYQNFGYDGYDPSIPVWETWEEAEADQDKVD